MTLTRRTYVVVSFALAIAAILTYFVVGRKGPLKTISSSVGALVVECAVPANWMVVDGSSLQVFNSGNACNIAVDAMLMRGVSVESLSMMRDGAPRNAQEDVRKGTFVSFEARRIDGFDGLLIIESGKDRDIQRGVWQGYGHGGLYTITMVANKGRVFKEYWPLFLEVLDSVKWRVSVNTEQK